MVFDSVSFNVKWVLSITKREFVKFPGNHLHWLDLNEDERKAKLSQVWDLIQTQRKAHENGLQLIAGKPKN